MLFRKFILEHLGGGDSGICRGCAGQPAKSEHNEGRAWDWKVNVNNPADVEETTQEVFINLLSSLHSFRGEGTFAAWVFGITRRVIANRFNTLIKGTDITAQTQAQVFSRTAPTPETHAAE